MASSSHNTFDGSIDQQFDQYLDQHLDEYFDQHFEETFQNFSIDSSDQEEERKRKKKRIYIERNCEEGDLFLWNDYFSETTIYPPNLFRRRFRMNKRLFMHIVNRLSNEIQFFQQKRDALGRRSLSPLQKCTVAIRVFAYGNAADAVDVYLRIGATTTRSSNLRCLKLKMRRPITCEGLVATVTKLSFLEDLEISHYDSRLDLRVIGHSCPLLKTFKLNRTRLSFGCDNEALAIAESMPELRNLVLFGNMLTNTGLNAILDNCLHLEYLDLRRCFEIDLAEDEDLEKRCSESSAGLTTRASRATAPGPMHK